jgi:hypothetical protein
MKKFLLTSTAIIMSLFLLSSFSACSNKDAELKAEIERVEKLAQRALDVQEVQNVWSRHSSYDAAGMNREQIREIWAQNQPDVAFIQNTEMRIGLDNIVAYYCDMWDETRKTRLQAIRKLFPEIPDDPKYDLTGWMKMHTNTTPNIQIAGDGQTAKGSWESPGFITELTGDNFMAAWIWERFFVDFIKEDGKWRIWHANLLVQFMTPFEKSWVESSMAQVKATAGGAPGGAVVDRGGAVGVGGMPAAAAAAKTELRNQSYAVNRLSGLLSENIPKQPEPYYTFSETFSYGPDMLEQRAAEKAPEK